MLLFSILIDRFIYYENDVFLLKKQVKVLKKKENLIKSISIDYVLFVLSSLEKSINNNISIKKIDFYDYIEIFSVYKKNIIDFFNKVSNLNGNIVQTNIVKTEKHGDFLIKFSPDNYFALKKKIYIKDFLYFLNLLEKLLEKSDITNYNINFLKRDIELYKINIKLSSEFFKIFKFLRYLQSKKKKLYFKRVYFNKKSNFLEFNIEFDIYSKYINKTNVKFNKNFEIKKSIFSNNFIKKQKIKIKNSEIKIDNLKVIQEKKNLKMELEKISVIANYSLDNKKTYVLKYNGDIFYIKNSGYNINSKFIVLFKNNGIIIKSIKYDNIYKEFKF